MFGKGSKLHEVTNLHEGTKLHQGLTLNELHFCMRVKKNIQKNQKKEIK